MAKRPRGTGHIWQPKGSSVWWCQYYLNGQRQRESTGETNQRKAEKHLQNKLAEVAGGNSLGAAAQHITVEEIVEDALRYHANKGNRDGNNERIRWELHLKLFFGHFKASQITTALIDAYIAKRQKEEIVRMYRNKTGLTREARTGRYPRNATINRELALLRSGFWLAYEATPRKVAWVPTFHFLDESDNVRKGFLRDDEYGKVMGECSKIGLWLRTMVEIYATFGWRKSELLGSLRVSQVDLPHRTIMLHDSKNGEPRTVKMTAKIYELLSMCVEGKSLNDYVFTRNGRPVKDFRRAWKTVTQAAGVPGLLIHDLRRTGARNLRRLGVHESTIMKIGGWKTRSVFDRYNIVDEADLSDAAARLDRKQAELENSQNTAKECTEIGAKPEIAETVNTATIN